VHLFVKTLSRVKELELPSSNWICNRSPEGLSCGPSSLTPAGNKNTFAAPDDYSQPLLPRAVGTIIPSAAVRSELDSEPLSATRGAPARRPLLVLIAVACFATLASAIYEDQVGLADWYGTSRVPPLDPTHA
jgi:hypothetical protein